MLDQDTTQVTTNPTSSGEKPGKGPFTITPADVVPNPVITVVADEPTTVMEIVLQTSNVDSVTVVFKDEDGVVLDTVTVEADEDVCTTFHIVW